MTEHEIAIWSDRSPGRAVETVARAGQDARDDWRARIDDPSELHGLEIINRHDFFSLTRRQAWEAAANAAVELAIIADLWPASVDDVFPRSGRLAW